MRPHILIALVLLALAARLPGLGWGLPGPTHLFSYHPDEFHSLRGVFSLATGDLNPHFFNYGCLYLDLVDAAASIAHGDLVSNLSTNRIPEALRAWTLDARVVSLLASVATVVVMALAAEAIAAGAGLWAGLALALMPLHALHARYATVDSTLCLFTALTLLFTILASVRERPRFYLLAGAAAGLAASTKYSGAIVFIVPLVALAFDRTLPSSVRLKLLAGAFGAALVAFAVTSPFVFIDWDHAYSEGIAFELKHMRDGESPSILADPSGIIFHLKWLSLGTIGLAPVGLLACLVYAFTRRKESPSWLPIGAFTFLAFVMIAAAHVRFARYEMILLPPAALGLGALLAAAKTWHPRALAVIWLLVAGYSCSWIAVGLVRPDTRDLALDWILANSAPADKVGLITEPWFQYPPVDYCNGGEALRKSPLWSHFEAPRRPLVITGYDPARLEAERPKWLVLSEIEQRELEAHRDFWRALREGYGQVWERRTRLPLELIDGLPLPPQDWMYPGIPIYVYKRTDERRALPP